MNQIAADCRSDRLRLLQRAPERLSGSAHLQLQTFHGDAAECRFQHEHGCKVCSVLSQWSQRLQSIWISAEKPLVAHNEGRQWAGVAVPQTKCLTHSLLCLSQTFPFVLFMPFRSAGRLHQSADVTAAFFNPLP